MSQRKILILSFCLIIVSLILLSCSREYESSFLLNNQNDPVVPKQNLIEEQSNQSINNQVLSLNIQSPESNGQNPESLPAQAGSIEHLESPPSLSELRRTSSIQIDVPFTSQAPFAVWDGLHNEACEEAVLIMAEYWLSGKKLTRQEADQEILTSVHWQKENWDGHFDLSVEKTVELAKAYFDFEKIYAKDNITLEDIKTELSKGNLIIVPTAGRLLDNPYYKQPGPVYHMLVVSGYDDNWIITNDPGTKRGEEFKYTYQNFFDSIHDWPLPFGQKIEKEQAAKKILSGLKAVIVVEK